MRCSDPHGRIVTGTSAPEIAVRCEIADLADIRLLEQRRQHLLEVATAAEPAVYRAIRQETGRTGLEPPGLDATQLAFALYYVFADAQSNLAGAFGEEFSPERATEALAQKMRHTHPLRDGTLADHTDVRRSGRIDTYPNQYVSPLMVAGYLRALGYESAAADDSTIEVARAIVGWLAGIVEENAGFVHSLFGSPALGERAPSGYLTFWCAVAGVEWRAYCQRASIDYQTTVHPNLVAIGAWAEMRVREMISNHYSGLTSEVDVIEVVYATLAMLHCRHTEAVVPLARSAIDMLFTSYFRDGTFALSAPAFVDVTERSVQIATAEALAAVALYDVHLLDAQVTALGDVVQWLTRQREPDGWAPEGQGRSGPVPYTTIAAGILLLSSADLFDDLLDEAARAVLEVPAFRYRPELDDVPYPGDLELVVTDNIITPVKSSSSELRQLASYSVILYGPPGSAKTTVAAKLAQDLRWPLLELGPGMFMTRGSQAVASVAEEVFEVLGYLKDVVILFDELEELVGRRTGNGTHQTEREARMLTTAMLPRLHRLRDLKRVVFIFATNRVEAIDDAVRRPGRFDIIRCVPLPDRSAREAMLEKLLSRYGARDEVRRSFESALVAQHTHGFAYVDLDALVREVLVLERVSDQPVSRETVSELADRMSRTINPEAEREFNERSERFDRPAPRKPSASEGPRDGHG